VHGYTYYSPPAGILEHPQGKSYSTFPPPAEYARRRYVKNRCRGLSEVLLFIGSRDCSRARRPARRGFSHRPSARESREPILPLSSLFLSLSLSHTHTYTLWPGGSIQCVERIPFAKIPRHNRRFDSADAAAGSIRCNARIANKRDAFIVYSPYEIPCAIRAIGA